MVQTASSSLPSPIAAAQLGALLLELYPLAAVSEAVPAGERLLAWLAGHIAFDAAWLGRSALEAGLLTPHGSHTHGLAQGFLADWFRVRRFDPVAPQIVEQPGCSIAMATDELPRSSGIRALCRDYRITRTLSVMTRTPASPWRMHLSLYRHDAATYDARECALLELLMPHLVSALDLWRPDASTASVALNLLSPREAEVARLFGQGMSYKAVARSLHSSPATVRHHLRRAYAKLGVTSKVQMARLVGGPAA